MTAHSHDELKVYLPPKYYISYTRCIFLGVPRLSPSVHCAILIIITPHSYRFASLIVGASGHSLQCGAPLRSTPRFPLLSLTQDCTCYPLEYFISRVEPSCALNASDINLFVSFSSISNDFTSERTAIL